MRLPYRSLLIALAGSAMILQWSLERATVLNASEMDLSGLNLTLVNFFQFFLVGFLLADLYVVDWQQAPVSSRRWDALAPAILCALWLVWQFPEVSFFLFPVLLFGFYIAVFRSISVRQFFCNPFLTIVGGMCYTIYLFHFQVSWLVIQVTKRLALTNSFGINLLLQTVLVGAVVLLSCSIYFLLVEKPCMNKRWHIQLWERLRGLAQGITPRKDVPERGNGLIGSNSDRVGAREMQ